MVVVFVLFALLSALMLGYVIYDETFYEDDGMIIGGEFGYQPRRRKN